MKGERYVVYKIKNGGLVTDRYDDDFPMDYLKKLLRTKEIEWARFGHMVYEEEIR